MFAAKIEVAINSHFLTAYIYKVSSEKYIKNLIVVTNNVFLDFDNPEKSKMLRNTFKGTFYYWILNKECIEKWEKRLEK